MDNSPQSHNPLNTGSLTHHQKTLAKGHLIDVEVKSHGIFPSFSLLDPELTLGQRIIDIFSDRFSFNLVNKSKKEENNHHAQELDKMVL